MCHIQLPIVYCVTCRKLLYRLQTYNHHKSLQVSQSVTYRPQSGLFCTCLSATRVRFLNVSRFYQLKLSSMHVCTLKKKIPKTLRKSNSSCEVEEKFSHFEQTFPGNFFLVQLANNCILMFAHPSPIQLDSYIAKTLFSLCQLGGPNVPIPDYSSPPSTRGKLKHNLYNKTPGSNCRIRNQPDLR
jgi:hypothetical protein